MTKQVNLKVPEPLFVMAERYVKTFGFRNIQELALESIREKVFESGEYDESFTEKEIELIDRLISASTKKRVLGTEEELRAALR